MGLKQHIMDINEARQIPRLNIDLRRDATLDNDPFYFQIVEDFHRNARLRHPKFPFIRLLQYGVAVYELPENHEAYLKSLESSARRNIKKALRNGYSFKRIQYNEHLHDIAEIHRSAPVRQGPMAESFLREIPKPIMDPPSKTNLHDYPYFGIMKDDRVLAYGGCLVAGEMLLLATVFGHDAHKSDGIVPLLIAGIAEYNYAHYPQVRYYVYDKVYGASQNLRRFKRKFGFTPCVVNWVF